MIDRLSRILKITGIGMLCIACGFEICFICNEQSASARAQLVLEQFDDAQSLTPMLSREPSLPKPTKTESVNEGSGIIGVLSIERLGLELPVLDECTDDLLLVSVCRYLGNASDEPERLVIAGHNYKQFFGELHKLSKGDKIMFVSINGGEYNYSVSKIEEISDDDIEILEQGEWDITLMTCTRNNIKRLLVRCSVIED